MDSPAVKTKAVEMVQTLKLCRDEGRTPHNLRTDRTLEFYHKEVKKLTEQRGIYQFFNQNESPSRRACLKEYQVATRIRHQSNRWLYVLKATMPRATAASGEHRNEYTSEMIEAELWQLQCGARIVSSRPRLI